MEIEKYAKDIVNLLTECFNEMLINDDLKSLMHFILTRLVKVTNNKYGFIGEIKKDRFGKQYLYQQTVVQQPSNSLLPSTHYKAKKHFFGFLRKDDSENELQIDNDQDIYDYEKLFDLIYSEKQIIISNDVNKDSRRQTRKDLDSQFKRFIGIPLFYQDEIISILILANYEGEYNNKYIDIIKPFIPLINNIIITYQKRISIIYQKNLFISNILDHFIDFFQDFF
jgi:GAF domain-containing protein